MDFALKNKLIHGQINFTPKTGEIMPAAMQYNIL